MFTNPIKRLSESLAQAQEQARQQRQKAQQRPEGSKSPVFDADYEEGSFVNGDEIDPKQSMEETRKGSEETKNVATFEPKDPSLPKEIRIKLAKLAKYEDRHPSTSSHIRSSDTLQSYKPRIRKVRAR